MLRKAHELYLYDPLTGIFTRRIDWYGFKAGTCVGSPHGNGYLKISIPPKQVFAHRLAWAMTYGVWPEYIDHINGDRSDNRLMNLRLASPFQNNQNSRNRKNNTSGVKGVYWHKLSGKWMAYIHANGGKRIHLGLHETLEAAAKVRREAAERLHGDFARHV
jgi:hypothetical protein